MDSSVRRISHGIMDLRRTITWHNWRCYFFFANLLAVFVGQINDHNGTG
jgi:thiosulfate reductase cytochrome b subunit